MLGAFFLHILHASAASTYYHKLKGCSELELVAKGGKYLHLQCADAAMDLDDDVPSPRTLRAAADRLAQYTSEAQEPASGPVSNVFSDLYSEVMQ